MTDRIKTERKEDKIIIDCLGDIKLAITIEKKICKGLKILARAMRK